MRVADDSAITRSSTEDGLKWCFASEIEEIQSEKEAEDRVKNTEEEESE